MKRRLCSSWGMCCCTLSSLHRSHFGSRYQSGRCALRSPFVHPRSFESFSVLFFSSFDFQVKWKLEQCSHSVRTVFAHCAHIVYTLCAQCSHTVRTLCTHYAHTVRTLCAHCAHTVRGAEVVLDHLAHFVAFDKLLQLYVAVVFHL